MNQKQSSLPIEFTNHALTRMQNRNISKDDVINAVKYGARISSDRTTAKYFIDGPSALRLSQRLGDNAFRLSTLTVVVATNNEVVTAYWPTSRRQ